MSSVAKASDQTTALESGAMSFEEALKKLESIVEAMESSDLPLDALLARFEEGAQLAQMCQARLAEAELKIQRLEKTAAGQMVLKPVTLSDDPG